MIMSLTYKLCLNQQIYSRGIIENKPTVNQLTEFHKIIDDMKNIEEKIDDEDKVFLLLNSLPISLKYFKDAFIYGKDDVITLYEFKTTMRSKIFFQS